MFVMRAGRGEIGRQDVRSCGIPGVLTTPVVGFHPRRLVRTSLALVY